MATSPKRSTARTAASRRSGDDAAARPGASSSGRNKVITTVNLEPEVRAFLDVLMTRYDRDRSYIVNALVKRLMFAGDEGDRGDEDVARDKAGRPLCPPAMLG